MWLGTTHIILVWVRNYSRMTTTWLDIFCFTIFWTISSIYSIYIVYIIYTYTRPSKFQVSSRIFCRSCRDCKYQGWQLRRDAGSDGVELVMKISQRIFIYIYTHIVCLTYKWPFFLVGTHIRHVWYGLWFLNCYIVYMSCRYIMCIYIYTITLHIRRATCLCIEWRQVSSETWFW